ncbi:glycosyltransferase family 1 protein [Polaribacter sp. WD7]|uniref:glycosyltransferase family 4 protein n=1 Tax=Polaribacter sp. WD7 TaxID=2269061 RepID=UPI000DF34651|nr:glycosyltransferase family 4 protein [Polaribacter sp. WD7]RCS27057.1 glycosyltransferase family 1 protein [Polaribacter sp. WD7]
MHIAFLTSEFPHKSINHSAGIGTSIYNICFGLLELGAKVSLIVYNQKNKEKETHYYKGLEIHIIKNKKHKYFGWYLNRKYIQKEVNDIVHENKIDIIEAPDWTGITAFMKFSVPLVIRMHGSDAFFCRLENRKQKKKNYLFEKLALNKANGLIAVSEFVAENTNEIFKLNKKIKVIPNGVALKNFVNNKPFDFKKYQILYFGTIIRKKGLLELAHIFNQVCKYNPKAKLILIGKDDYDKKTNSKSTFSLMKNIFSPEAFTQVTYLGKKTYQELKKYILESHICVFPSLAESFGMVTIEAMALQKAVVSSNYKWAQEIINHKENGILEDPKNHKKFSQEIVNLLSDENFSQEIGKKARLKVEEKFDIFKISKVNIDFYKTIIHNH